MLREIELQMPESLDHHGRDDFEEIFVDELQMQTGEMPLSDFTTEGGCPDDETLDFEIESIKRNQNRVVITVSFEFVELVPTGCADVKRSAAAFGKLDVVLELDEKRAYISHEVDFDE